ncbi:winged helix-turn-helix transcriptional regulator [bacterium]|nr:winged helix-turn-helix transcriptional regulator [bacterium]
MKSDRCKNKSERKLRQVLDFLKIISEENRIKILRLLERDEKCVCEIWQYLKLPQNLVSHHLKVLKDFDLISSRKEGVKIFYKINKKVVKKYLNLLNKFLNLKED